MASRPTRPRRCDVLSRRCPESGMRQNSLPGRVPRRLRSVYDADRRISDMLSAHDTFLARIAFRSSSRSWHHDAVTRIKRSE